MELQITNICIALKVVYLSLLWCGPAIQTLLISLLCDSELPPLQKLRQKMGRKGPMSSSVLEKNTTYPINTDEYEKKNIKRVSKCQDSVSGWAKYVSVSILTLYKSQEKLSKHNRQDYLRQKNLYLCLRSRIAKMHSADWTQWSLPHNKAKHHLHLRVSALTC